MENAHDAFPIEFLDIQQNHRLLFGKDLVSGIRVSTRHHRQQVERELRGGLLRLRSRYLAVQRREKEVVELMARSLASFATLARHALIIAQTGTGAAAPAKKREIFAAAAAKFGLDAAPFETVLELREETRQVNGDQAQALFASYLEQITKLEEAVDRL